MFTNLAAAVSSAASAAPPASAAAAAPAASAVPAEVSTDPVTFIVVGVIVLALFLGIVIRVLRRNRLKK